MLKVAVIGATGAVGREMLAELEHFGVPCDVGLFASPRSAGSKLKFHGKEIEVKNFAVDAIKGYRFALMSAGGAFSKEFARAIAAAGCAVIDNSSAWRMADDIPLVVPEVNPAALASNRSGIIANPNCSTIQLVVSLKPLSDQFGLSSVNVSTYQSVSGSGQAGINELENQARQYNSGHPLICEKYQKPIFNNLIPAIDVVRDDGHCFEEEKMIRETRKIMGINDLPVLATTVRVPVFKCHSESVTVQLKRDVHRGEVVKALAGQPGLTMLTDDAYEGFAYPKELVNQRDVFVSRIRLPLGQETSRTVQYWNVADNLKKGAATNAVQILKVLLGA